LLTVQELARALKLNPQTLYRLVRQGLVPAVRIGNKTLRFDPAQVRAILQVPRSPRPSSQKRSPGNSPFAVTRLDDLRASEQWITPPTDLALERFAVRLPPGVDIATLAYDREAR
jgi:excisionase family DNA binding protein